MVEIDRAPSVGHCCQVVNFRGITICNHSAAQFNYANPENRWRRGNADFRREYERKADAEELLLNVHRSYVTVARVQEDGGNMRIEPKRAYALADAASICCRVTFS
jgi:G:T/U-mismatch repair DNA glycosylase